MLAFYFLYSKQFLNKDPTVGRIIFPSLKIKFHNLCYNQTIIASIQVKLTCICYRVIHNKSITNFSKIMQY